ncbi:MAG: LptE family protein [Bacteroidales bacterium]|nr:LptE family protein [Bacteroidales bacterium]
MMKKFLSLLITVILVTSCGIYSFSGTSIQPDVHTICVEPIVNNALKVNPSLSNQLTEALLDKYKKLTKLRQVDDMADLYVSGEITSYDIQATAITADEVAAQNRLTVTVRIKYSNVKYPEEDFEQNFVAYRDYSSERSLDEVEATLCDEIVETIVEDIFNATVAQW